MSDKEEKASIIIFDNLFFFCSYYQYKKLDIPFGGENVDIKQENTGQVQYCKRPNRRMDNCNKRIYNENYKT